MKNWLRILFSFLFIAFSGAYAQRIIHFAGVDWQVKNGGPWGPGPNYWSADDNSVWLDSQGRLHLKIRKENNRWYCAEVTTTSYTTYGEHRFLVEGKIDEMDKNIVLGLFLYADDAAEIDIEYSKWGVEGKTDVGSFTVQPYTTPGNSHPFVSPLDSLKTTHFLNWQPDYVLFGSMQGHFYNAPPSPNNYLEQWIYTGSDNPSSAHHLRTHINFWLNNGQPPTDFSVLEVIITDVLQPLSTSMLDEGKSNQSPKGFELKQNFPNPFNPNTRIEYQVVNPGRVRLSVFNNLGQKIRDLVNRKQKQGRYQVTFKANGLPAGVYFYRLQINKKEMVRKMVYLP